LIVRVIGEGSGKKSGCGLIGVVTQDLPGGTQEGHENPQKKRCRGRDANRVPPVYM